MTTLRKAAEQALESMVIGRRDFTADIEALRAALAEPDDVAAAVEAERQLSAELLDACKTFAEWLRREEEGFAATGKSRNTPEGESEFREWFYENLRICNLAQKKARAAIVKAEGKP